MILTDGDKKENEIDTRGFHFMCVCLSVCMRQKLSRQ